MFIFGIVVAFDQNSSIFQVVSYAWAGLGASFGPLMLTSLYWRRTNKYGAIAGMLSGTATVLIWHNLVKPLGGIFAIYELLPGVHRLAAVHRGDLAAHACAKRGSAARIRPLSRRSGRPPRGRRPRGRRNRRRGEALADLSGMASGGRRNPPFVSEMGREPMWFPTHFSL